MGHFRVHLSVFLFFFFPFLLPSRFFSFSFLTLVNQPVSSLRLCFSAPPRVSCRRFLLTCLKLGSSYFWHCVGDLQRTDLCVLRSLSLSLICLCVAVAVSGLRTWARDEVEAGISLSLFLFLSLSALTMQPHLLLSEVSHSCPQPLCRMLYIPFSPSFLSHSQNSIWNLLSHYILYIYLFYHLPLYRVTAAIVTKC